MSIRKKLSYRAADELAAYSFVTPAMLGYLIFVLIPMVTIFVISMNEWTMLSAPRFVGLNNYIAIFKDPRFYNSMYVTLLYVLHNLPLQWVLSMILALMLRNIGRGMKIYRTFILLPWVTMPVAIAIVWRWVLNPLVGVLNYYLSLIGLRSPDWLGSLAMVTIAGVNIYIFLGFSTLLLFIGMQNIPADYYEAAEVDGVGAFRKFFKITLPLLKPTILYMTVTGVIGSFQVFEVVYSMTQGGPGTRTNVLYYSIYLEAFLFLRMGTAASMSVILFFILLILTLCQMYILRNKD